MQIITDLRENLEKFIPPLNTRIKNIIIVTYTIEAILLVACIFCMFGTHYMNKKTLEQIQISQNYAKQMESITQAIVFSRDCKLKSQKLHQWIVVNLPIQNLLVDILSLIPENLKIKNLSTIITENKNQLEFTLDVVGRKDEALKLIKDIEQIFSKAEYKLLSSSSLELIYGNRIFITSSLL